MTTDVLDVRGLPPVPPPDLVNFDSDDYSLPRWKVDKDTGSFVNTMTGEEKSELTAIVLKADKSRFYWPSDFKVDNLPICHSLDGLRPVDQTDTNPWGGKRNKAGIWCIGCAASAWNNGERPKCAVSYNYLLLDVETDVMAVLNLSRARTKTAKALNSLWRLNGVRFSVRLFTEVEQSPRGSFYQVRFALADKQKNWGEYALQMHQTKDMRLTGSIEQSHEFDTEELIIEGLTTPQNIDKETGEVKEESDIDF